MNTDPWQHVLKALEPEIERLTEIMEIGSRVVPVIEKTKNRWKITLTEKWILENDFRLLSNDHLKEAVDWSTEQLQGWPDVNRMAYDMWFFKRKRDAEKFQILFNLKWAE